MAANVEIKIITQGIAQANQKLSTLGRSFEKLKDRTKGTVTSLNNLKKSFVTLQNAAVITGGILAVKAVSSLVELGAGIEVQTRAFDNLTLSMGAAGKTIIAELTEVSRGTVATTELIGSASRAMLLGIAPEKLTKLMEIARAASKATGDTISKSFDDITLGIGRNSKMILDNLGIIVRVDEANQKYAASINKTANELTDAEKKQAFLNATLEAGQVIINNVGADVLSNRDKVEKFKVKITEAKNSLALLSLTIFEKVEPALSKMISALTRATTAMSNGIPIMQGYTLNLKALLLPASQWGNILVKNKKKTEDATASQEAQTAAINKAAIAQKNLNETFEARMKALGVASEGTAQAQGDAAFNKVKEEAKRMEKLLSEGSSVAKGVRTPQEVLNDTITRLNELRIAGAISMETLSRASQKAVDEFKDISKVADKTTVNNFTHMQAVATAVTQNMTQGFEGFFLNAMDGFKGFGDFAVSILDSIKQQVASVFAGLATSSVKQGLTHFSPAFAQQAGISTKHSGGLIMHNGGIIPSFHTGGALKSDERLIKAQTGEGILSRKGMNAFDRMNQGDTGSGNGGAQTEDQQVTIVNMIDPGSLVSMGLMDPRAKGIVINHISADTIGRGTTFKTMRGGL